MTPKYTPPCPRVTVEPEGYSRTGDFEYAKEPKEARSRDLHEEGELSRSPSPTDNDFADTVDSVDDVMDHLAMKVERARGEADSRDEHQLIERLQGDLSRMQNATREFLEKQKLSHVESKLEVFVENIKHVLKTEEDVFNYFIRLVFRNNTSGFLSCEPGLARLSRSWMRKEESWGK